MKSRILVTALYPNCPFSVGDILSYNSVQFIYRVNDAGDAVSDIDAEKCTTNFRKLEWWERRTHDEMPEYVKLNSAVIGWAAFTDADAGTDFELQPYEIIPNVPWAGSDNTTIMYRGVVISAALFVPATKAEYDTYRQSLQS